MDILGFNLEENVPDINISKLLHYVSPAQQKRIKAFKFQLDAERVLIGDLLVRSIACQKLTKKNSDLPFKTNRYGKPYLLNAEGFHYNVSHSGNWVVVAVDSQPVGIDVEAVKKIDLNIAKNFFCTEEVNYIMNVPAQARADRFYEVWTLKESYIKALGCGLSKDLKSVSLKIDGNSDISVTDSVNHDRFLYLCKLEPDYFLAVCTCYNDIPAPVKVIDMQWIMAGLL